MDLNKTEEGKQLIKNFNKIAEALLQYEVLFYRNWERSIDLIKKGMQATVYIRHPETKVSLYLNESEDFSIDLFRKNM
jgi:dynein heavy chain